MKTNSFKNIKIGEHYHKLLKDHCDKKGIKIYRFIEKWISETCKQEEIKLNKKKDLYDD